MPVEWTVRAFALPGAKRPPTEASEDAANGAALANGCVVLVVADGLGSAAHGAAGARKAVELCMAVLSSTRPTFADFQLAMEDVRDRWFRWVSGELGASIESDYGTTLLVALIDSEDIYFASIGDCFAVIARGNGRDQLFLVLEQEKPDADSRSATAILSGDSKQAPFRFRHVHDAGVQAVMLSTDGLEDSILDYESIPPTDDAEGQYFVRALNPGAAFALMKYATTWSSADLAKAIASEPSVMNVKGDDIGVAIAAR